MQATVVFVVGWGESVTALRRMAGDVDEIVKRMRQPGAATPIARRRARNESRRRAGVPRQGRAGRGRRRRRRISCESMRRTRQASGAAASGISPRPSPTSGAAGSGARLHGASDPAFETISVLGEAS
jgi:hypothetical protein